MGMRLVAFYTMQQQGVVTLIYAVVTALTGLLAQYTKEGVESLHILPGQGQNVHVVKWVLNEIQCSQTVKSPFCNVVKQSSSKNGGSNSKI